MQIEKKKAFCLTVKIMLTHPNFAFAQSNEMNELAICPDIFETCADFFSLLSQARGRIKRMLKNAHIPRKDFFKSPVQGRNSNVSRLPRSVKSFDHQLSLDTRVRNR